MEECELCGRKIEHAYVIEVEGVELRVCASCAAGKHIISEPKDSGRPAPGRKSQEVHRGIDDYELVENYGAVIRAARESMKLPLKVLAEMLNEKETLLLRIEEQKTLPSAELVKKLEKALNIKLYAEQKADAGSHAQSHGSEASMGEFLER
ncbi:MAG: multiprotein bridging factor aMBF1 [Candidatus Micrarchaeia archaeon]